MNIIRKPVKCLIYQAFMNCSLNYFLDIKQEINIIIYCRFVHFRVAGKHIPKDAAGPLDGHGNPKTDNVHFLQYIMVELCSQWYRYLTSLNFELL